MFWSAGYVDQIPVAPAERATPAGVADEEWGGQAAWNEPALRGTGFSSTDIRLTYEAKIILLFILVCLDASELCLILEKGIFLYF